MFSAKHGGRYLIRGGPVQVLEGNWSPNIIVVEFADRDSALAWYRSPEYASALEVYSVLGQPDRLGVMRLPGFHGANDVERNLDWLDIQFGRVRREWRNDLLFP